MSIQINLRTMLPREGIRGSAAFFVVAAVMMAMGTVSSPAETSTTVLVKSTADQPDSNSGDGKCLASNASCTLRAAIQRANASPGPTP